MAPVHPGQGKVAIHYLNGIRHHIPYGYWGDTKRPNARDDAIAEAQEAVRQHGGSWIEHVRAGEESFWDMPPVAP